MNRDLLAAASLAFSWSITTFFLVYGLSSTLVTYVAQGKGASIFHKKNEEKSKASKLFDVIRQSKISGTFTPKGHSDNGNCMCACCWFMAPHHTNFVSFLCSSTVFSFSFTFSFSFSFTKFRIVIDQT